METARYKVMVPNEIDLMVNAEIGLGRDGAGNIYVICPDGVANVIETEGALTLLTQRTQDPVIKAITQKAGVLIYQMTEKLTAMENTSGDIGVAE